MISNDEKVAIKMADALAKTHPDQYIAADSGGRFSFGKTAKQALANLKRQLAAKPPFATTIHRVDTTQPIAGCKVRKTR